jgi:hypothetical protein
MSKKMQTQEAHHEELVKGLYEQMKTVLEVITTLESQSSSFLCSHTHSFTPNGSTCYTQVGCLRSFFSLIHSIP